MDERAHFPLDNIPPFDKWLNYIAEDGSAQRCLAPWTPDVYRTVVDARIRPVNSLSPRAKADLELYGTVDAEIISPSTWSSAPSQGLSAAFKLAKLTFKGCMSAKYSRISNIHGVFVYSIFETLATTSK